MGWSASQYSLFENERTRPVRDLLSAIPGSNARTAVDLGCGPGNSTQVLADRFPGAIVTGLDSSADMIAAAHKRLPGIRFEQSDVDTWDPADTFDVILANAVFQWIPDHQSLFPRLVEKLNLGGHLAVQMPNNEDEPAKRLMREVAVKGPWSGKLTDESATRFPRHSPDWYYELLQAHCGRVDIWRTTYYHVLPGGAQAIVEWFKGSSLRPFLAALNDTEKTAYLDQYRAALEGAYLTQPNGTVLLPFPRLFMVATR